MSSLKEDLENVEIEEADMDEEDRLRKIEESMYWLNRKIKVIAEYIDKEEEKATPEEEELWDCGYSEGYEDGVNSVMNDNKKEIEAIEKVLGIPVPSQNLTSLSHAIQNFMGNEPRKEEPEKEGTSSERSKGYKDGMSALAEMLRDEKIAQAMANKKELIDAMEKVLSIKMPSFEDAQTIISQIQPASKNETTEGEPDETKENEIAKRQVLGLGRRTGDV